MAKAPEQQAREHIDAQLSECGWAVQDFRAADFSGGRGIALREVRLKTGPCDYLLLVDRKPVGVIEAKKQGVTLSRVADQSASYAENLPEFLAAGLTGPPPFRYESTGVEMFFLDQRDPYPRSRRVFTFHRPETLGDWSSVRFALEQQPMLAPFADSVQERYEQWLKRKEGEGAVFASEQRAWLGLIRDHIATRLSIEPEDFEYSPFTQRGGLGKAHQVFGAQLPRLLDELNEVLAA